MLQVESIFNEIVDSGAGKGMMMAFSSFNPPLAIEILVCYLPSHFSTTIHSSCRCLASPRLACFPLWLAMRHWAVSAVFFLSDITSLVWSHEGATSRFTEEKENHRNREALLKTLEHNKSYIHNISVGLKQFGFVWQHV